MIRICSTLAEAGHEVTLVGRMNEKSIPLSSRNFKQKRLKCWLQKGKMAYVEYNIRLFFFLLFQKLDVVNAVDLDTILAGYAVAKLKQKDVVYDAHEYFTELPEVVTRPKTQQIWKKVERFIVPKMKYCYTVCQSLADLYQKEYGIRFEVVRNVPFKREIIKEQQETNSKIILYQGALNTGRGLEQMIDAMQGIQFAKLWLIGEGDLSQALRKQVQEAKLNDKVKFLGYVQPDELASITPKAYIGINLLKNQGLSYYYSLANKSFDYIQALVPAIHMDFPEYQNIVQHHEVALLIPDLKTPSIQNAIQQLLNNEALYTRLQNNCRKAREEYIWEKEKEKLLGVYSRIIRKIQDK